MSTNTGVAPALAMAPAVAKKVNGVVITSSPGPTPQASRALKKFYEYLVDESLLTGNPVIRRRLRVREPDRLPRFLTPEEKEKVLAWFRDHAPPNVALAFHTLFASGLRLGECVALRPGDLLVRDNAYLIARAPGQGRQRAPGARCGPANRFRSGGVRPPPPRSGAPVRRHPLYPGMARPQLPAGYLLHEGHSSAGEDPIFLHSIPLKRYMSLCDAIRYS